MILLADNEGPDETARMRSHLGIRCPHMAEDTFFFCFVFFFLHGAALLWSQVSVNLTLYSAQFAAYFVSMYHVFLFSF